jgi:hypothetical protein
MWRAVGHWVADVGLPFLIVLLGAFLLNWLSAPRRLLRDERRAHNAEQTAHATTREHRDALQAQATALEAKVQYQEGMLDRYRLMADERVYDRLFGAGGRGSLPGPQSGAGAGATGPVQPIPQAPDAHTPGLWHHLPSSEQDDQGED